MRIAGWPLPSVIAGSLRATLAKAAGRLFTHETIGELLGVSVTGFFPICGDTLYLPAPNDCVIHPELGPIRAAPQSTTVGGCDWPAENMQPVNLLAEEATEDFKPKEGPAWWPVTSYAEWLVNWSVKFDERFLRAPATDDRTHVQIDCDTGASQESLLFTTSALPLAGLLRFDADRSKPWSERFAETAFAVQVEAGDWAGDAADALDAWHPLGGERRLAHWKSGGSNIWSCPPTVAAALTKAERVRMVLATPAVFSSGWKPGWLDNDLTGSPMAGGPKLKLVGLAIQRWRAVSGWSMAVPRGPKPVRRAVPSGGVYFFQVIGGNASDLADRWLKPVSDKDSECRDGFGLATWGTW
jgi:CRISPR-associated protein Cmr3